MPSISQSDYPETHAADFYVTGGALAATAPSYVERDADAELSRQTTQGEYCYVLTPRQMGKSSLMVRTAAHLENSEIRSAIIDLTSIRQEGMTADRFFAGLLDVLIHQLKLPVILTEWWHEHSLLGAVQRFSNFVSRELLRHVKGQLVIFVDEIDSIISLDFSDDLFATIRAFYNERASNPEAKRLAFVLLGVASPPDLIKDRTRTPFNIGRRIELTDFRFKEARSLARGLGSDPKRAERILRAVLYWTGGHPYLTQKVCASLSEAKQLDSARNSIEGLVHKRISSLFFSEEVRWKDNNLATVRSRLLEDKDDPEALLELYRRIRSGRRVADDGRSAVHSALKLSGVVKNCRGILRPRNRIYHNVFDLVWVENARPSELTRQAAEIMSQFRKLPVRRDNLPVAEGLYAQLRRIRGYEGRADELMAKFNPWILRALDYGRQGNPHGMLLCYLKALTTTDTKGTRCEAAHIINNCTSLIRNTFRLSGPPAIVRFDFGGRRILAATPTEVIVWCVETGQPLGQPIRPCTSDSSSPDRSKMVTASFGPHDGDILIGSDDGMARTWDLEAGTVLSEVLASRATSDEDDWEVSYSREEDEKMRVLAFNGDGSRFVSGSYGLVAQLWDYEKAEAVGDPMEHLGVVDMAVFSCDGRLLATSSDPDEAVHLWSTDTGKPIGIPMRQTETVRSIGFCLDDNALFVATDKGVSLFSTRTAELTSELPVPQRSMRCAAVSPDVRMAATAEEDGIVRLWGARTGAALSRHLLHLHRVRNITFSPDGLVLATASEDGVVRVWEVAAAEAVRGLIASQGWVVSTMFSHDGRTLAVLTQDNSLHLWDAHKRQEIGQPIKYQGALVGATFSPDDHILATGFADGTARYWEARTGEPIGQQIKHPGLSAIAFRPGDNVLVTAAVDGTVIFWEPGTGKPAHRLVKPGGQILMMTFSPDGRIYAIIDQKEIQVRDTEKEELICTRANVTQHKSPIQGAALSPPDGRMLATYGTSGTARFWYSHTSELLCELMASGPYEGRVRDIRFSPDGKALITAADYALRLWDVESGALKAIRFLPARFSNYRFLSEDGTKTQVALRWTESSVLLRSVRFDSLEIPPIHGDPASLLQEWSMRLGLKLDEKGVLTPF